MSGAVTMTLTEGRDGLDIAEAEPGIIPYVEAAKGDASDGDVPP